MNINDRCAAGGLDVQTICSLGILARETTCSFCMKPRATALYWRLLQTSKTVGGEGGKVCENIQVAAELISLGSKSYQIVNSQGEKTVEGLKIILSINLLKHSCSKNEMLPDTFTNVLLLQRTIWLKLCCCSYTGIIKVVSPPSVDTAALVQKCSYLQSLFLTLLANL